MDQKVSIPCWDLFATMSSQPASRQWVHWALSPEGSAAVAWAWPLTSTYCRR